jgi:ribosomal protein S20
LAKTPRTWTGARTPSGLKRVRQAERRHAILQPRRTAAKTFVSNALIAASAGGDAAATAQALADAHAALDRAAKVGAIHPNAAARRKSRLTLKFNAAAGGALVQTGGRVTKTTSKAQATKAAKARIAVSKADKAKGAQTAAGKARAALSKTARTEAAAAAAAKAAAAETVAPKTTAKAGTTKAAGSKTTKATASKSATKAKAPAKASTKASSKTPKKPAAKA